uniref:Phlebovirus_G2 domain-containing protein n=1 Tax=Globodera pallida TaxID=36090 RepID=A0A183BUB5_GLOPA
MECVTRSEGWYRSYVVDSKSNFRCPRAKNSSCFGNTCGAVKPEDKLWELKDVNDWPGHSHCLDSLGSWGKGCALWPSNGCLFYRTYARTTSQAIFEKIGCPTWRLKIVTKMKLEMNSDTVMNHETEAVLYPGMHFHWHNITLTPLAISLPPAPILSSKFITLEDAVALVEQLGDDLPCSDESSARDFNCTLAPTACSGCSADHETGVIGCSCRDLNLEERIEDPQQRLPLTIGQFHLRNEESRILADTGYSPVQLHVEMKDVEMILQLRDSKCWIEAQNITGCYRCQTGAQFWYQCRTDWGRALAKVECADGTIFAATCSTNQSAQREVLNFDQSRINTKCSVDCPAGITDFVLEGELYYVPIKHRSNFRHRQSERLDTAEGNWFDLNFDPWALTRLFFNPWSLLVFAVVLVVGVVALALFLRFNPPFAMFRMVAGALAAQGQNSPDIVHVPTEPDLEGPTREIPLVAGAKMNDPRSASRKVPTSEDVPLPPFAASPEAMIIRQMSRQMTEMAAEMARMKREKERALEREAREKELEDGRLASELWHQVIEMGRQEEEEKEKPKEEERKRSEKRVKRSKSRDRHSEKKKPRTASREPPREKRLAAGDEGWTKAESERRLKKRTDRRRRKDEREAEEMRAFLEEKKKKEGEASALSTTTDGSAGEAPALTEAAKRILQHFAKGAARDIAEKRPEEIPPSGKPAVGRGHRRQPSDLKEIIEKCANEEWRPDGLVTLDPRGREPSLGLGQEETRKREAERKLKKLEERRQEEAKKLEERKTEEAKKLEERRKEEAKKLEERKKEEAKKLDERRKEEAKKPEERKREEEKKREEQRTREEEKKKKESEAKRGDPNALSSKSGGSQAESAATTMTERRELLSRAATSARTPTEDLLIKMTLEAMGHAARMERLVIEYLRRGGGSVADSDVRQHKPDL